MTYTLIFDNKILEEYKQYYFKTYPKRSKFPIKSPLHPSINEWFIMKRPQMNGYKQQWKEFTIWVVKKYGYENLHIKNAQITYKFYYGTKRRHDNDNMAGKFSNDGLTEAGMIFDDDYFHLNPMIIEGFYDKENPRMEIIIEEKNKE